MIITVPVIVFSGSRNPDLPSGVEFSLIADHGDTMTVEVSGTPEQLQAARWSAATRDEKISEVRWRHETGGTMWRGYQVRTDRESQSKIIAASLINRPLRWKFGNAWAWISAEDIADLAKTVTQHVEACFAREEELQANPGEDIESGWPPGYEQAGYDE
jgi:hypothetical protein